MSTQVYSSGRRGIARHENMVFMFEAYADDKARDIRDNRLSEKRFNSSWEDSHLNVNGWVVFPYGHDNNLPIEIRDAINEHHLAPGIYSKKSKLTWGMGPVLRRWVPSDEGGMKVEYVQDPEVEAWLKSFNYKKYLLQAIDEFLHMDGHFTKVYRSRGHRVGMKSKLPKMEAISNRDARLCARPIPGVDPADLEPTHVMLFNWTRWTTTQPKVYPLFDILNPDKYAVSIAYSSMYDFAQRIYSQPDVVGLLNWLKVATGIPKILNALSENSLNIRYHIRSPQKFWDYHKSRLEDECKDAGKSYNNGMLEDFEQEVMENVGRYLAGKKNVGKFIHTKDIYEMVGNEAKEMRWYIDPIDQKIQDFVNSQIKISERADYTSVMALGLHQALSNVGGSGKSDSGSEQLYAMKNYMLSERSLPELIILEIINKALEFNFPEKKLELCFYGHTPEREMDITPKQRIANA